MQQNGGRVERRRSGSFVTGNAADSITWSDAPIDV